MQTPTAVTLPECALKYGYLRLHLSHFLLLTRLHDSQILKIQLLRDACRKLYRLRG
jgi:hypothetical protein